MRFEGKCKIKANHDHAKRRAFEYVHVNLIPRNNLPSVNFFVCFNFQSASNELKLVKMLSGCHFIARLSEKKTLHTSYRQIYPIVYAKDLREPHDMYDNCTSIHDFFLQNGVDYIKP